MHKNESKHNLLECFNDWSLNVEFGFQTAVVYIDFAKAFDSVSHQNSSLNYVNMAYEENSCLGSVISFLAVPTKLE